jgi:protein TonB
MPARTTIAASSFLLLSFLPLCSAKAQEGTQPKPGLQGPRCIYCPGPEYSEKARDAHLEGSVVLNVTVTTEGRIIDASVVKGPGMGLEEKALEAVKKWELKPVIGPGGKPVAARIQIQVSFHIRKGV